MNHRNNNQLHQDINFLDKYESDSEQRPRRLIRREINSNNLQREAMNTVTQDNQYYFATTTDTRIATYTNTNTNTDTYGSSDNLSKWGVVIPKHKNTIQNDHDDNRQNTINDEKKQFPYTFDMVAQDAFHAISSTLYCKNYLDPNIVSNAMATSIIDKRPVGFAYWPKGRDVGRLGIEIDNARFLFSNSQNHKKNMNYNKDNKGLYRRSDNDNNDDEYDDGHDFHRTKPKSNLNYNRRKQQVIDSEGRALRRIVLILASKLGQNPWSGLEDEYGDAIDIVKQKKKAISVNNNDVDSKTTTTPATVSTSRPIAIYFNTLRQALLASKELQLLQQIAHYKNQNTKIYENIRILCLKDNIPKDMMKSTTDNSRKRKWGSSRDISDGKVNPQSGIIIIVQPTDYDSESRSPSPSIDSLQALQILLSKASVNQIPSIVVSPRLIEQFNNRGGGYNGGGGGSGYSLGYEQSGYQQSSTYGGVEPPKGPTPWILRDFIPPVYTWIGCGIQLSTPRIHRPSPSLIQSMLNESNVEKGYNVDVRNEYDDEDEDNRNNSRNNSRRNLHDGQDIDIEYSYKYYSRVVLTQSVMESGHPWNLYAVENNVKITYDSYGCLKKSMSSPLMSSSSTIEKRDTNYQYIANTGPHCGRPTKELLLDVLTNYNENNDNDDNNNCD